MKPFKLIVAVDGDGKSKFKIEGDGRRDVTKGQVITYLAGELEKFKLEMIMEDVLKKMINEAKAQVEGIQVVKNMPDKLKGK
jgi:hypothetical protein